jgi:hypothetical protein
MEAYTLSIVGVLALCLSRVHPFGGPFGVFQRPCGGTLRPSATS